MTSTSQQMRQIAAEGPVRTRVVVADDSTFLVRRVTMWLEAEGDMEVVANAADGQEAIAKVAELRPDIAVLDVRMPKLDGLRALHRIMSQCPTPVLLFCDRPPTPEAEARLVDRAKHLGALEVIFKPNNEEITEEGGETGRSFRQRVRMLSKIKVVRLLQNIEKMEGLFTPPPNGLMKEIVAASMRSASATPIPAASTPQPAPVPAPPELTKSDTKPPRERRIVLIGCSTGGPDAVRVVLSRLPPNFRYPIIIAQHMPRGFTGDFAEQLARISPIPVAEAGTYDVIEGGRAYVAPGGHNLTLSGLGFRIVAATRGLQENCPCIDELFVSAASRYKEGVVGVILTGMGNDGEKGVRAVKAEGGVIIAQDEKTSDIFGMPKMAIGTGTVDMVAPIQDIAQWIVHYTMSASRATIE